MAMPIHKNARAGTDAVVKHIDEILRSKFDDNNSTVDVTLSGIRDNIHVVVVSKKLDRYRTSKTKQEYLWKLIDESDLSEADKHRISLIMPLSPAELK
jgi:hypothetical protein